MKEKKEHFEWAKYRKGAYFALAVAVISGFSVYINKFAVTAVEDSFVFTTVKNIAVALLLFSILILPKALPELRSLSRRQWLTLGAIGCIGGSIPFLLFFYGLSQSTAIGAAFIHKTMFIWIAIMAVFFLGERLGKLHIAALAVLIVGNILLVGWPTSWLAGSGDLMILLATLFWAVEAIVAKKVMKGVSFSVAAFGRMFFGAIIMLSYLAVAGKISAVTSLGGEQVVWIAITSIFLSGYVYCYYAGLKYAPASMVAGIMVLGSVITSLLYVIFDAKSYTTEQVAGMIIITVSALVLWYIAPKIKTGKEDLSVSPVVIKE